MRKEDLEKIAKNGQCYTNEARDMAKMLLAGKLQMSPQEVIDDLLSKGFNTCANEVAAAYGLPVTLQVPDPYYPFLIP